MSSPSGSSLGETLRAAMNAARKAQDKERTLVLGTILANLKNREIELRRPTTDDEVAEVLRKGIKIRREASGPRARRTQRKAIALGNPLQCRAAVQCQLLHSSRRRRR